MLIYSYIDMVPAVVGWSSFWLKLLVYASLWSPYGPPLVPIGLPLVPTVNSSKHENFQRQIAPRNEIRGIPVISQDLCPDISTINN